MRERLGHLEEKGFRYAGYFVNKRCDMPVKKLLNLLPIICGSLTRLPFSFIHNIPQKATGFLGCC